VAVGDRVVLEPALHCGVRGIDPPCPACQQGQYGNCVNVTRGDISAGVQTGYCRDTGGGWSHSLVAHEIQVHRVPEGVADESAVMLEPFSCALHAVLSALNEWRVASGEWRAVSSSGHSPLAPRPSPLALVIGCGTMGLAVIAALRAVAAPWHVTALARFPHQQDLARSIGADEVIALGRSQYKDLAQRSGATLHQPEIGQPTVLGGFDLVFDCVGSPRSLDDALRFTRSRGRTVLVGMPAIPRTVDWTTIWFKELRVMGVYAYGIEDYQGERLRTFELALRFLEQGRVNLRQFVTHKFALNEYRQAIRTALDTGSVRSIKTVFDLNQG
jgi:threonine dehydrogenase-like Zn-dependent dehydrogenase